MDKNWACDRQHPQAGDLGISAGRIGEDLQHHVKCFTCMGDEPKCWFRFPSPVTARQMVAMPICEKCSQKYDDVLLMRTAYVWIAKMFHPERGRFNPTMSPAKQKEAAKEIREMKEFAKSLEKVDG
jgi:hypothetical protein